MERRTFLKAELGAAALAFMSGPAAFAESKKTKAQIALQVYSVRDYAAKDLDKTLEQVAAIGYKGVEFAGYYDHKAEEVRKMLDKYGLKAISSHVRPTALLGEEFKKTVEFEKILGNNTLIVSSGLADALTTEPAVRMAAWLFNELADKAAAEGMRIGYHAHGPDFTYLEKAKTTGWNLFFKKTNDSVIMQMDVGNCLNGGNDPYTPMEMFPKRNVLVHFKPGGPSGIILGSKEDPVNWKRVFKVCEDNNITEWYIVEQSKAKEGPNSDSMVVAKGCFDALKAMGKA